MASRSFADVVDIRPSLQILSRRLLQSIYKPPSSSSCRRNFPRDQGYTCMLVLFSLLWRARVSSIVPPFASAHSNSKPALATPLVTGNVISKKE